MSADIETCLDYIAHNTLIDATDAREELAHLRSRLVELQGSVERNFRRAEAAEEKAGRLEKALRSTTIVLCETRGHAGNRPCQFCHDMHIAAALSEKP
jgi:hypothetical protein